MVSSEHRIDILRKLGTACLVDVVSVNLSIVEAFFSRLRATLLDLVIQNAILELLERDLVLAPSM